MLRHRVQLHTAHHLIIVTNEQMTFYTQKIMVKSVHSQNFTSFFSPIRFRIVWLRKLPAFQYIYKTHSQIKCTSNEPLLKIRKTFTLNLNEICFVHQAHYVKMVQHLISMYMHRRSRKYYISGAIFGPMNERKTIPVFRYA